MTIGILIPLSLLLIAFNPAVANSSLPLNQSTTTNQWLERMRDWRLRQSQTDPGEAINSALMEIDDEYDDTTVPSFVLQLSCDEDQEGSGWRYYRCGVGFGVRPEENREGQDSRGGHTREEN